MNSEAHKRLGNMAPDHIIGNYQTSHITHYDGNTRQVLYTEKEITFPENGKIVSVADLEGNITNVNSTFVEMSGYSKDELLGAPYYILHHPDIPQAIFEDQWRSLSGTGYWKGYIKNLRKDGAFYWAFTSVFPLKRNDKIIGYTSYRTKPEEKQLTIYKNLYEEMLSLEKYAP